MSTDKQRDANKRNAQKSTGPRTDEGKKRASTNAVRHGLFSKDFTLTEEEKTDHRRLLDSYLDHFRPEDPIALDLVEELAMAKMRQKRAWALEASLLRIELGRQQKALDKDFPHVGADGRIALCVEWLADEGRALDCIRRYEAQLRRAWERCLDRLERRRPPESDKSQNEPNSAEALPPQQLPSGRVRLSPPPDTPAPAAEPLAHAPEPDRPIKPAAA
jgi:hypothetical protein